jgi:O-methyltransferase
MKNFMQNTSLYIKNLIRKKLQKYNYDIVRINTGVHLPADFEELHTGIYNKVSEYTMTSPERIYSLIEAISYIEKNKISGDIVECGVWKGGSMIAVTEALKSCNSFSRELYLYDTFEGMSEPTEFDKTYFGKDAASLLNENENKEINPVWAYSTLETVQARMNTTGYPENKIKYIKGKVEDTIPATIPSKIAVLRLDTDWYESTRHELIHLFPLLTMGGVLILDDYGYWQGARRAADEYFKENKIQILLNRIDETGRIAVKQN